MTRRRLIFAISIIALLSSITAVLGTTQERDLLLQGYVNPVHDLNLPYKTDRPGINAELTQYTPAELAQHLQQMEQAGIVWVRQFFHWDEIESQPEQFSWEVWDSIVAAVAQRSQLRLVAVLYGTPDWATAPQAPIPGTAPPENPDHFARFAAALAARYGHSIDHYQIWDEPNLQAAWGGLEPRVARYVNLLCTAYTAIRGQDAGAMVISAALAPTIEEGPRNISDILYLQDMYRLGAGECMDAAAAKPYGFNTGPDDRRVQADTLNFSRIIALREIMVAHGDARKPLWASSGGWNTLPPDWDEPPSIWGSTDSQQAAAYLQGAFARAEREWPWLAGLILQQWQPAAPPEDPIWGFAILDHQGQPTAFRDALLAVQHPTSASNGLFHPVNPYTSYSGVWEFGPLGADVGWLETTDSQLTFRFTGRDLALLLREDDYIAFFYPTIDSRPPNALPRDNAGNAYLFLRSASLQPELNLVQVAHNLPGTEHTLHITANRGWDRWPLAGFAVSDGDLAAPYNRQIIVSWLATAIALAAVFVSGRGHMAALLAGLNRTVMRLSSVWQVAISAVTSLALMLGLLLTWQGAVPAIFRQEPIPFLLAFATAGLAFLNPGVIITLAALAVLFVLICNRLQTGLLLTLFWAPFFLFPVELYRFAFPMAEVVLLITAAAWLLRLLASWGRQRQSASSMFSPAPLSARMQALHPMDYAVLAWVLVACITLLWTGRPSFAITELRTIIIEPALFYLIFRSLPPEQRPTHRLIMTLLAAGFAVAAAGLLFYIRGEAVITAEEGARRLASVYGSPNNVALFLGRVLPFALAFTLLEARRLHRLLAAAALFVMLAAFVLTQSVGGLLLGLPAAFATVVLAARGRRALGPLLLALVIGLLAAAFLLQASPRFASLLDFTTGTNFFRLRVWESALDIIRDHPITGIGLDQFLYEFRGYYIRPDAIWDRDLSHPHNFVLDLWTRLGVAGVAIFAAMQLVFWKNLRATLRVLHGQRGPQFILAAGLAGSMANLLAHGLVDNSIFVNDLAYVFMLHLALGAGVANTRAIDP